MLLVNLCLNFEQFGLFFKQNHSTYFRGQKDIRLTFVSLLDLGLIADPSDYWQYLARERNEPVHEKTNNFGSDQVRRKPGCTVTEDG